MHDRRRACDALGLAFLLAVSPAAHAAEPPFGAVEHEIVEAGNAFRGGRGVAPLALNEQLAAAAHEFAAFMARTDRYGHEADGRQPTQRAQAHAYAWCLVDENIAMQYGSAGFADGELARRFAQGWIESPGHRRNLLDAAATETGVAVARSAGSGRYYAVQMFGRPAAARQRFEISNRSARDVRYRLGDTGYALAPGSTRRHEQCIAQPLEVSLPGQAPIALQTRDGARWRIEGRGRELRLLDDPSMTR
ncbi:MAG TPA: CAP domain-containing protein [Burkholderiaceae bacterium]|nr:CAP domain-containing protein [Burkholderiaceae bacterium]